MRTCPLPGSQKRSSRLASVVLPAPEGPTSADGAARGDVERDAVQRRAAGAGIGKPDPLETDRRAAGRLRRVQRPVDHRRLLVLTA